MPHPTLNCPCEGQHLTPAFAYTARPEGEIAFPLVGEYRREYRRCSLCEHWFSRHEMDLSALYDGTYVDATYGDSMRRTYERIMALPRERSDNLGRLAAVRAFADRRFGTTPPRSTDRDARSSSSSITTSSAPPRSPSWRCAPGSASSRSRACGSRAGNTRCAPFSRRQRRPHDGVDPDKRAGRRAARHRHRAL